MFTNNSRLFDFFGCKIAFDSVLAQTNKLEQSLTETTFLQFLLTSKLNSLYPYLERFYCFEFGVSAKFRVYNFGSDIFQETWGCRSRERGRFGAWCFLCNWERAMSSRSSNDATDGAFQIKESSFRQFISRQPGAEFLPEKGRYHLYISYACPWASKCYAFMKLKGLEDDVIGLMVTRTWRAMANRLSHYFIN